MVSCPAWRITRVDELFCDIGVSGMGPSTNGFAGLHGPSQPSLGSSRNYERDRDQEPAVRLPPGPIPRTNSSNQPRQALPPQDISSNGSRFQSQSIPSSGGNMRLSDAYGGTTTSVRVSSGPRPTTPSTPSTPSRDQANRHGPRPPTPSSRPRGLPTGPSHLETPEFPPPSRPQGPGYPDKPQTSNISYHSSRKQTPPIQNQSSISGLPPTNGASGFLIPTFNRTSSARDDGTPLRPPPLTLQTPTRSGYDPSPTTPGIPRSFSPGFPSGSNTNKPDTGVNGTTRLSDTETSLPKPSGPVPSPLAQRTPQLPEPTKPSQPPQISRLQPPFQPLSPLPRTPLISPNGPPPSAFNFGELGPPPSTLNSGLPSRPPSALRSAPPSALVTSLPLRPADTPHSRNARISFFDPPNQTLLDRLLATDSAIVASPGAGAGGGDNEEESVRATLTSVEEMLDGFEWATEDIFGKNSRDGLGLGVGLAGTGSAEQIEARLLDELMALEKVRSVLDIHFMLLIQFFYRQTFTRSSNRTIG